MPVHLYKPQKSGSAFLTTKVNGYIFKETCCFHFYLLSQWDQLLKERICSSGSKFLPIRVDSIWIGNIFQVSKKVVSNGAYLCKYSGKS